MKRLGYFVPEFPGQTHIFFWREIQRLEELGVDVDIVSTKVPPAKIRSHTWSDAARARTNYLIRGNLATDVLAVTTSVFRYGLCGWWRCIQSIGRSDVGMVGKLKLFALALVGARFAKMAHQRGWKHVHVHSCANAANIAMFAHLLSGLTYSVTLHGPLADYGPNQTEKWSHAKFGIVITQKLFAELRGELGEAATKNLYIAPMGVNVGVFQRQSTYQPFDGAGPATIYTVGRLNPCKGHANLIEAVAQLRAQGIDCTLKIAGEDEQGGQGYRNTLQATIDKLNVQNSVQLLGAVSEQVIRDGLNASHIFALASVGEPLGVAIMEAMALEMPVVVTAGGGVKELVDDGVDGLLVHTNEVSDLVATLDRVLRDTQLAKSLASESRQKIIDHFQDSRSAELLLAHVEF
jgi:colanic acid/amylovoran biosynthesis glycosyltransferase